MPAIGIVGVAQQHTMGTGAVLSYQLIPASVPQQQQNAAPAQRHAPSARQRQPEGVAAGAEPDREHADAADELRRRGGQRATTRRDRQLPVDGNDTGDPRRRACRRGDCRLGADPHRLRSATTPTAGDPEDARLHETSARGNVAWQSTVAVAIGSVIGAPLGIVLGRTLWNVFARQIDVVASPTIPVPVVALVVVGALILANAVAAIPGYLAARTRTAVLLHSE